MSRTSSSILSSYLLSSAQCIAMFNLFTSLMQRRIYLRIRQSIERTRQARGDGHLSAFVFPEKLEKRPKVAKAAKSPLMASLLSIKLAEMERKHARGVFLNLVAAYLMMVYVSAVNYPISVFCLRQNKTNHIVLPPPTDFKNHRLWLNKKRWFLSSARIKLDR